MWELKPKCKAPSLMQINHDDCDTSYAITLLWICPHNNAISLVSSVCKYQTIEKEREKKQIDVICVGVKNFSCLSNGIITPEEGKLRMTTL